MNSPQPIITFGILLALLGPPARGSAQSAQPAAPNVLFVMADDLGWGELGSFGQRHIPTPRLDRLATEGMNLTSHYSGSPVCAPSRCVLSYRQAHRPRLGAQ